MSGAVAASEADIAETTGCRADESVTRCTLEADKAGTDGCARGMARAWSLAIDCGAGGAPSARRCTMGRTTDGKSRLAELPAPVGTRGGSAAGQQTAPARAQT